MLLTQGLFKLICRNLLIESIFELINLENWSLSSLMWPDKGIMGLLWTFLQPTVSARKCGLDYCTNTNAVIKNTVNIFMMMTGTECIVGGMGFEHFHLQFQIFCL